MAPVALPEEGSFALNAFGEQSPSTGWRTERQNNILLLCVLLITCYSYLTYHVKKVWREAELRYRAEQRTNTEQRERAANSTENTRTGIEKGTFPRMSCRTDIVHLGPSPAIPVNRPKAKHPLYGSLTATELPKPREESMMISQATGGSMAARTHEVQPSLVSVTTKAEKTRPTEPSRSRTDHPQRPKAIAHQERSWSPRTTELMIPYGTFEGSFREVAPNKTKKRVVFAEDASSKSSWSTIVSGYSQA